MPKFYHTLLSLAIMKANKASNAFTTPSRTGWTMDRHQHARYGPGRKPQVEQAIDASIHDLYRRLLGYVDEIKLPSDEMVPVLIRFPVVESAAWADEIVAAARVGTIPFSTLWRLVERDAARLGVYPPPGDVLATVTIKTGKRLPAVVPALQKVRGKIPCKECGVPTSPIYQNVWGVCFDCQMAESSPTSRGASAVVAQEVTRRARRVHHEDEIENKPPDEQRAMRMRLLNLTPDQYEVAQMYAQGYTPVEIGEMTNRTRQRINMIMNKIRQRCRRLGFGDFRREEDRRRASRHVQNADPQRLHNWFA